VSVCIAWALLLQVIAAMRWRAATRLFSMIPITAEFPPRTLSPASPPISPSTKTSANDRNTNKVSSDRGYVNLRGSSSIFTFPLLNNGNYEGIPAEIVATALSHVSHLMDALATVLNIPLDHPVRNFDTYDCAISPHSNQR
jgi:hypothetical protein